MPADSRSGQPIRRLALLDTFVCAGGACPDTCCRGWSMVVDETTLGRYRAEAPELLESVMDGPVGPVMKRDPRHDACVRLAEGWCGIQKDRGERFLGDACHFYPRVTRRVGEEVRMSACLSCPLIAERAFYGEDELHYRDHIAPRLPATIRDIAPTELGGEGAKAIIEGFLSLAADPSAPPERNLTRIVSVAHSLRHTPPARWAEGAPFLIDTVDERLAIPAPKPEDPHRLLLALAALAVAAQHPKSARFMQTFAALETGLGVTLDWSSFRLSPRSPALDPADAYPRLAILWQFARKPLDAVLRRWLQIEIDSSGFPFAGLGTDIAERSMILAVRFATLRLALMCEVAPNGTPPAQETVVRTAQSLARLFDHLAEPALSLSIYREQGWSRESRLRALVGDDADALAGQELPSLTSSPQAAGAV